MLHFPLLASNPFFEAYHHSDLLGKGIFLMLIALSIISWSVIIHKLWLTRRVKKYSEQFRTLFEKHKQQPLHVQYEFSESKEFPHPFFSLYRVLKNHTVEILKKNLSFKSTKNPTSHEHSYLSPSDIDLIESHLASTISTQVTKLESHLYILATIVTLAPFLGLLGTVWGILTTFSELQAHAGGASQLVLGGLSMALATTVLGLVDAIPALIGYNYLKNIINDFRSEMENFTNEILASVEFHYRMVEVT